MAKKWMAAIAGAMLVATTAACGGGSKDTAGGKAVLEVDNKPVELTIYMSGYDEARFAQFFGNFVKKKYPNVSFKLIGQGTLADVVTSGTKLDLFQSTSPGPVLELSLQNDVTDLIKKYNFDVNALDPAVLETMRIIGNGGIYGFPNGIAITGLFYNRDLFDKFGVAYPKNGMKWDEVYELARKMTRKEGDVQVLGFAENVTVLANTNQMSQPYVDPKTTKAALNNDAWKKFVSNLARFHTIPGNELVADANGAMQKEKRLAMFATQFSSATMTAYTQEKLNWGIASLPELPGYPGVGTGAIVPLFYVANGAPNRDWAFKVASFFATNEYQTESAAVNGVFPSMKSRDAMEKYAKDIPTIPADKKILEAFPKTIAKPYPISPLYDALVVKELAAAFNAVAKGTTDVNTALREAEDRANQAMEAVKKK
ncbi:MAG: extracellular solute-binding protein family 1 [Paenibacillus sp.]|nr:extracellular solute-binding protein family 1 [Paenibacillus sp.]